MDLSLQHGICFECSGSGKGFNPCFNGSFTSTMMQLTTKKKMDGVSILVLMDLSLQRKENQGPGGVIAEFQSLF